MADNSIQSIEGINLASKYEKGLLAAYTEASVLTGKVNTKYSWEGVNSIHLYSIVTQPLGDYKRTGVWRYSGGKGPSELQDKEQTLIITQDKGFQISIDNGNNEDQMNVKSVGEVTKEQIAEQVVPFWDKYALNYYCTNTENKNTDFATLDKSTILDLFVAARKFYKNNHVPNTDRYAYCPTSIYSLLLKNPEFLSVEKLAANELSNGVVGKVMGFSVVEIPDDYLTEGTNVLFAQKNSVLAPAKAQTLKVTTNDPNVDGAIISGRYRGDAFILNTYKNGVIAFNAK